MSKSLKTGLCHLCGRNGPLSFEHVPPESAFNNRKTITPEIRKVLKLTNLDDLHSLSGKQSQHGHGGYTLCIKCNNDTGGWYGGNYVDWAIQGALHLAKNKDTLNLSYTYHLFPLRVIKQIICMFFSANPPSFREAHRDLERFVLNKELKYFPTNIQLYVGYLISDRTRSAGVTGSINLNESSGIRIYSEISFPPFSYILSFDSPPPEHPMLNISSFATYGYQENITLQLPIPVLSIYTPFPGDFRNRETVLEESNE